ncbi:hypothetical protein ACFSQD_00955 [Flavihumibacter stibioxidans]|uniref:Uncharacterized protein n=1 Tax=Flavihumibacter stibioxidans TaxID=1834163 RepID=A0ABR7M7V3_9BACT|nr:hypothetical protein [Flavihumibacter stibioxidans]MBC6490701.1 hypothetical protein [Flavihumibacter stibioxidans]
MRNGLDLGTGRVGSFWKNSTPSEIHQMLSFRLPASHQMVKWAALGVTVLSIQRHYPLNGTPSSRQPDLGVTPPVEGGAYFWNGKVGDQSVYGSPGYNNTAPDRV